MFGRQLAITLVKPKRKDGDSVEEPMDIEKIGETIVETTAGVGAVIVIVASTLTALRVGEQIIKYIIR